MPKVKRANAHKHTCTQKCPKNSTNGKSSQAFKIGDSTFIVRKKKEKNSCRKSKKSIAQTTENVVKRHLNCANTYSKTPFSDGTRKVKKKKTSPK